MHDKEEHAAPTGFLAAVENTRNRIIACVVLSVLLALDLVLAGVAIHQTPKQLDPTLGVQAGLSIFTFLVVALLIWRPLAKLSRNMARFYFAMNIFLSIVWGAAVLALAISMIRAHGKEDKSKRDLLSIRDTKPDKKAPAAPKKHHVDYGCLLLGVVFAASFVFNTVYVHTRLRKLYPKYSEIDDGDAFNPRMDEDHEETDIQMKDSTHVSQREASPEGTELLTANTERIYSPDLAEHPGLHHGRRYSPEITPVQASDYHPPAISDDFAQRPEYQSPVHQQVYADRPTEYRPPHMESYQPQRPPYHQPAEIPDHRAYYEGRQSVYHGLEYR